MRLRGAQTSGTNPREWLHHHIQLILGQSRMAHIMPFHLGRKFSEPEREAGSRACWSIASEMLPSLVWRFLRYFISHGGSSCLAPLGTWIST